MYANDQHQSVTESSFCLLSTNIHFTNNEVSLQFRKSDEVIFMDLAKEVITILEEHRGKYISGEQLSERLSVSRSAVWKVINTLREDGHHIIAVRNKGYQLASDSNVLSPQGISKYLHNKDFYKVSVVKTVDSTNNAVKTMGAEGLPEGTVLAAEQQTNGKGRQGRSFLSPPWEGIYFSILLRPNMSAVDAGFITSAAAVAVSDAVEAITGKKSGIKWVNDVFYDGKKICGILTEASVDMESGGLEYAVLGIGVNITVHPDKLPEELRNIIGGIADDCGSDIRNRLIAEILNAFHGYYNELSKKTFLTKYRLRSTVIGHDIFVIKPTSKRPAFAERIDDDCRLVVRYEDGFEEALSSGEVSIRHIGG